MRRKPNRDCVVKVGDGRGFIITRRAKVSRPKGLKKSISLVPFLEHRLIVTAGHCLPRLPTAFAGDYGDRTYEDLLGSLDGSKKGIWAQCLFVDPIADIAVLGAADGQELFEESGAYEEWAESLPSLPIGNAKSGPGWVLSLDGKWTPSRLEVFSSMGGVSLSVDPTEAGMSGSPILDDNGMAVGVVAIGHETGGVAGGPKRNERCGPQPILWRNLPEWLLPRRSMLLVLEKLISRGFR